MLTSSFALEGDQGVGDDNDQDDNDDNGDSDVVEDDVYPHHWSCLYCRKSHETSSKPSPYSTPKSKYSEISTLHNMMLWEDW